MFYSFGCSRILHSLSLSLSLRFAQLCFARALALLVPRSRLCSSRASSSASSLLVPRLSSLPGSTPLFTRKPLCTSPMLVRKHRRASCMCNPKESTCGPLTKPIGLKLRVPLLEEALTKIFATKHIVYKILMLKTKPIHNY